MGRSAFAAAAITLLIACSQPSQASSNQTPRSVSLPTAPGTGGSAAVVAQPMANGVPNAGGSPGGPGSLPPTGSLGTGGQSPGTAGVGGAAMMAGGTGGSAMSPNMPFTGPLDGDPSKPMVSIPGVPCGVPQAGFGGMPATVKITNRDVVVAYPCAHEGAAVTFFLFLHGTVDEPIKVSFTMNAWPIHQLVDSHNIIVVAPKAITTQWGNGDNGQDLPHLYDVVDWVYATFGSKFDIRSMWTQGGSWGAFYLASTFACDPKFKDRLKGIQLIVGGGCPACSDRLSCMVAQQELQLGNNMQLTPDMREMVSSAANIDPYAKMHGCQGKMGPTAVGNAQRWTWPSCDPGWTHQYYLGPGQHADAWDPAVVLEATEEIKATEQ